MTIVRMFPLYRLCGAVFVFVVFFCMAGKIIVLFYILIFIYVWNKKESHICAVNIHDGNAWTI